MPQSCACHQSAFSRRPTDAGARPLLFVAHPLSSQHNASLAARCWGATVIIASSSMASAHHDRPRRVDHRQRCRCCCCVLALTAASSRQTQDNERDCVGTAFAAPSWWPPQRQQQEDSASPQPCSGGAGCIEPNHQTARCIASLSQQQQQRGSEGQEQKTLTESSHAAPRPERTRHKRPSRAIP